MPADAAPPKPAHRPVDLGAVYEAAKIRRAGSRIHRAQGRRDAQSEHIRALPADVKRKSIMVALDAAGVKVTDIVEDAVRRDRALDTYERVLQKYLEDLRAQTAAENQRIEDEIAQRVAELRARIDENTTRSPGASRRSSWPGSPGNTRKKRRSPTPSATSFRRTRSRRARIAKDKGDADVR